MRVICFLIGLLALTGAAHASGAEDKTRLKMEGAVATEGAPGGWSAILNGQIAAPGQTVDGYEIISVDDKGVRVRELETGEVEFIQSGGESGPAKPAASPTPEPSKEWWELFLQQHFPQLANFKEQFFYAGVIRELKKIHFEAMQFAITENKPVSMDMLVGLGKLPPLFLDKSRTGYRFAIQNLDNGTVRVTAEPAEAKDARRYFLMDEHSYVYSETGRPATQKSPVFSSGYSLSVLPS